MNCTAILYNSSAEHVLRVPFTVQLGRTTYFMLFPSGRLMKNCVIPGKVFILNGF